MSEQSTTDHPGSAEPLAPPTVIIHEAPRSGSGVGIVMAVLLLVVAIGGLYLYSRNTQSSVSRDQAVTAAANKVGDTATKVGDAASQAVSTEK